MNNTDNGQESESIENKDNKCFAYVIQNPDKPLEEAIIILPENYKKGVTYHEYLAAAEKVSNAASP